MSVPFNNGNGLKDLKECVVDINGEVKNVVSIYGNEYIDMKKLWGQNNSVNNSYLLCTRSGDALISKDGVNYTKLLTGLGDSITKLFFHNNRLIAINAASGWGASGIQFIDLDSKTISSLNEWNNAIRYINGAILFKNKVITTSSYGMGIMNDDFEWSIVNNVSLNKIVNNNDNLLVGCLTSGYYGTSVDGITWNNITKFFNTTNPHDRAGLSYGNGYYVYTGYYSSGINSNSSCNYYSTNGTTWSKSSSSILVGISTFTGKKFVGISSTGQFCESTNGITWTSKLFNLNGSLTNRTNNASNQSGSFINVVNNIIFYSTSTMTGSALFYSADEGNTWGACSIGDSEVSPRAITYIS